MTKQKITKKDTIEDIDEPEVEEPETRLATRTGKGHSIVESGMTVEDLLSIIKQVVGEVIDDKKEETIQSDDNTKSINLQNIMFKPDKRLMHQMTIITPREAYCFAMSETMTLNALQLKPGELLLEHQFDNIAKWRRSQLGILMQNAIVMNQANKLEQEMQTIP